MKNPTLLNVCLWPAFIFTSGAWEREAQTARHPNDATRPHSSVGSLVRVRECSSEANNGNTDACLHKRQRQGE